MICTENSSSNKSINLCAWLLIGNCSWWQNAQANNNVNEYLNGLLTWQTYTALWLPLQFIYNIRRVTGLICKNNIYNILFSTLTIRVLFWRKTWFVFLFFFSYKFFRRLNETLFTSFGEFLWLWRLFVFVCMIGARRWVYGVIERGILKSNNRQIIELVLYLFSNCGIDWQIIWLKFNEGGLTRVILEVVFT